MRQWFQYRKRSATGREALPPFPEIVAPAQVGATHRMHVPRVPARPVARTNVMRTEFRHRASRLQSTHAVGGRRKPKGARLRQRGSGFGSGQQFRAGLEFIVFARDAIPQLGNLSPLTLHVVIGKVERVFSRGRCMAPRIRGGFGKSFGHWRTPQPRNVIFVTRL